MKRRSFLLGSIAMSGAAISAVVRVVWYDRSDRRIASMRALSAWEVAVVDALAERICAADVPYDSPGAPPRPRECEVVEFVDAFIAESEPAIARDLHSALGAIEHAFPVMIGSASRFSTLSPERQDRVLSAMEASSVELVRGCFAGVKSLVMMGYYRDPRTWGVLGYDGPMVARPAGGWVPLRHKP